MDDEPIQYGRLKIPPGFPKEADYNPPPPPSPYFDLWLLPDPPDDEKVCFNRAWIAFENERALSRGVLETLAKHHLWGIDWNRAPRMNRGVILKALWKLFYYMPERNRPRILDDLVDLGRDAGPRLLGYEPRQGDLQRLQYASNERRMGRGFDDKTGNSRPIIPPQPVSIQHPRMPPPMLDGVSYDPPFYMPEDAKKLNLRPSHVRQYLFPLYKIMLPKEPWTPLEPNDVPEVHREAPIRRDVLISRTQQVSEFNESEIPRLSDGNPPSSDYPPLPRPRYATEKIVNVAIVEALMKLTYHELQRDDAAPARGMAPHLLAENPADLDTIQICMGPSAFEVKIDLKNLNLDPSGKLCQYQGRGPVGSAASASIDTVIVVGMLTEAGCTAIDRYRGRHEFFDDVENAYIEVTNMNWDCMDVELSRELRDSFFRKLHTNYPAFAMGQIIPPWAAWAKLTRNFAQFQYTFQDRSHYCACEGKTCEDSPVTIGNCLLPPFLPEDRDGVTPGALVSRKLGVEHKWGCGKCNLTRGEGRITERTMTRLPPRLSLLTNSETRLVDHTADFTFMYRDANGVIEEAKYRWLGGIYHCNGRLRVYWTDGEPGRMDPGTIRGYDPRSEEGVIAGSIPAAGKDRVPGDWLQSTIPLLIYEKVIDPPKPSLLFWGAHITHMLKNSNEGRPALLGHTLPPRKRQLPKAMHKDRRLPSLGDACFEIDRPDPGFQLELDAFTGNSELNLYSLMKVNPFHPVIGGLFEAVAKYPLPVMPPGVAPALPPYPLPEPVKTFDSLLSSPDIYFQNPQTWSLGSMEVRERRVGPADEENWEGLGDGLGNAGPELGDLVYGGPKPGEPKYDEPKYDLDGLEYGEPVYAELVLPAIPQGTQVPQGSQERGAIEEATNWQADKREEAKQAEAAAKEREQQMAQEMWLQWINFSPSQSQKSSSESNKSHKSNRSEDTHMGGTSVGGGSRRRRAGAKAGAGAGVQQRGTKGPGRKR